MSMINIVRRPLQILINPRLFIYRHQSQKTLDLLNRKAPIEIETNDELETLPCENTIDWNKKLKFYRIRGEEKKALKLFEIGLRKHKFQPDYITYISMIELCKETKDLDNGRYIHRFITTSPVRDNSRIQTLLMELYMKCGDIDTAREMFDSLKHRTIVEYNLLMGAFNANNYPERTIDLFNEMKEKHQVKPNNMSYTLYFQACVALKVFDKARAIHQEIENKSTTYMKNKELSNQIVAMYVAAGDYTKAEEIFNQLKEANVQNYVSFMKHYNQLKNWERTLQLYDKMKTHRKIQFDPSTYLTVLEAVKQMDNVDKAKQIQADILKQNLWQNHSEIQKLLKEILKT